MVAMLTRQSILCSEKNLEHISSNPVEVTGNYSLIKRSLYLVNNKPMNKGSQHLPLKGGLLKERQLKTSPSEPALCSWLQFLCVCC